MTRNGCILVSKYRFISQGIIYIHPQSPEKVFLPRKTKRPENHLQTNHEDHSQIVIVIGDAQESCILSKCESML